MAQRRRRLSTDTDAEVIAASRSDPEEFGVIFDRHFDAIYRYLASRVGADLADDLASDVFTVAFRRRPSYALEHENALPWLYGIATNLLRHHYRTEARRLRALARSHPPVMDFDMASVVSRVDAAAKTGKLAAALAELKRRDRDVLLLFAGADLSYEEIARALDIPVGTVRSRLNRARRILRERMGSNGEYLGDSNSSARHPKEVLDGRT